MKTQKPLVIKATEAAVVTRHFLHCGVVQAGDRWDTTTAWADPDRRALARRLLLAYRADGTLPTEDEFRYLNTCCGDYPTHHDARRPAAPLPPERE